MQDASKFIATTWQKLNSAEKINGEWKVKTLLEGMQINNLFHPGQDLPLYAATQENGVLVSHDRGKTWKSLGMEGIPVKSLAIHPQDPQTIYAGCKPVSLFVSRNGGETWQELESLRSTRKWWWFSPAEPPDWRPYVQALTISPDNPDTILAGMEVGGVLRSEDGGRSWSKPLRGADVDCHSLKFHPTHSDWVYQGGGNGVAFSKNGGRNWKKPKDGLGPKYGWMVAGDSHRPEVWYFSASDFPKLWRGEFVPPAHNDGNANAHIYRKVGETAWELLSGGLPEPLDYMAYALIPDPEQGGHLYAGLANGDVWHTGDYGDTWSQLPFNLGGIHRDMILI
jgi:hypothetical protein